MGADVGRVVGQCVVAESPRAAVGTGTEDGSIQVSVQPSGKKPASFEENLTEVERAIRALEAGDIPLEDSIDLYAKAMEHLKACHGVLDRAESRLEIVRRAAAGDGPAEAVPADLDGGEGVRPARSGKRVQPDGGASA